MRTGYSAKEVVRVGSSKERLEKQLEGKCSFLAAMQRGRDHEHRVGRRRNICVDNKNCLEQEAKVCACRRKETFLRI